MLIMGALFSQIKQPEETSRKQSSRPVPESREFMDQMARDLRAAGYPNTRNFSSDPVSPQNRARRKQWDWSSWTSVSFWFESSIDGSGKYP